MACGGGGGGGGGSSVAPFVVDNVRGRTLNFPNRQVHPLAFAPGGGALLAVNQPASRLIALDLPSLAITAELPAGPGLTSVVVRPGTSEVWTVDWWSSALSVFDLSTQAIVRTVRVGAGPVGIAFTPSGDRAYVTCSQVDRVDVVETSSYSVVNSIAIPAREPNGVVFHQGHAWIASLRSGNGTAPRGRGTGAAADEVVSIGTPGGAGETALPDRDLFAIRAEPDPRDDMLDSTRTVSGLGTTLFTIEVHPTTGELWIPQTDALNAVFRGAVNFPAGQVVRNRVAVVDPDGVFAPRFIDLDALAPAGSNCAQPTGVAFAPDGSRAFVCGFGSDAVAVLDLTGAQEQWAGTIRIPAITVFPESSGPRAALVDPAGANLYVFDKLANAVTPVSLAALPGTTPFDWAAPVPASLGSNPLPLEERQGRAHFVNARHSDSGTSSCASCHVDGATDGLVWDLSDFLDSEGTPSSALSMPIDDKGPLFTQETLQLAETAPFHWRGEKGHLELFDRTFPTLFEHRVNGVRRGLGDQFPYIRHYMQLLVRRPNPNQSFDRELRPAEARGATLFRTRALSGGVTCATCHQLPLGTSGEVVTTPVGGVPTTLVVPQLRGVAEKLTPVHTVGGDYGVRSELGAGLLHAGSAATLEGAVQDHLVHLGGASLTPAELSDLAAFLRAFDNGIAPSAAFQLTLHAGNADGAERAVLDELIAQAELGHCDVIAYRGPDFAAGGVRPRTEAYDPGTDAFESATGSAPTRTLDQLVADARGGTPVTFLGVPLGQGRSMALDRDSDALRDLDEYAAGTDPEKPDSDGDGFPDGYELTWGMDPLTVNTSSPDTVAPALSAPLRVVYRTGHGGQGRVPDHRARARARLGGRHWRPRTAAPAARVRRRVRVHRPRARPGNDLHRAPRAARRRRQPPRVPLRRDDRRAPLRSARVCRGLDGRRRGRPRRRQGVEPHRALRARGPGRPTRLLPGVAALPQTPGHARDGDRPLPAAHAPTQRRRADRLPAPAGRHDAGRQRQAPPGHRRDPRSPGRPAPRLGVRRAAPAARAVLRQTGHRAAARWPVRVADRPWTTAGSRTRPRRSSRR